MAVSVSPMLKLTLSAVLVLLLGGGWNWNHNISSSGVMSELGGAGWQADIPSIAGLQCSYFRWFTLDQTYMKIATGDRSCSGEVLERGSGRFRQVNFLSAPTGSIPVVVHSPRRDWRTSKGIVVYLNGGPRHFVLTNSIIEIVVDNGYTVVVPLHSGPLDTRHPSADLPLALNQVRAVQRWAARDLVATIGISGGGVVALAACALFCTNHQILLAPLMTSPRVAFSHSRIGAFGGEVICLKDANGNGRRCAKAVSLARSFWGRRHYDLSLSDLAKDLKSCNNVSLVVSERDQRVFDWQVNDRLRARGCSITYLNNLDHHQFDVSITVARSVVGILNSIASRTLVTRLGLKREH